MARAVTRDSKPARRRRGGIRRVATVGGTRSERLAAIQALGQSQRTGDELILLQLLDDRSAEIREAALSQLWERGGTFARLAARACLTDVQWPIRLRAAEALEFFGTRQQDVKRLADALHRDSHWTVRASAASALGGLGGPRAHRALVQAMNDPSPHVRRYVAVALGRLNMPGIRQALAEAMAREQHDYARVGLLPQLYRLGHRDVLPDLLDLLKADDALLQYLVLQALSGMTLQDDDAQPVRSTLQKLAGQELDPPVLQLLEGLLYPTDEC